MAGDSKFRGVARKIFERGQKPAKTWKLLFMNIKYSLYLALLTPLRVFYSIPYIGKQKVTPLFARITDLPSGFYCIFDGQFFGFFCSNKNFTQKKLFIAFLMDNFSVLLELFDFARSNTPPLGGGGGVCRCMVSVLTIHLNR